MQDDMKRVFSNRGVAVSDEHYDKLWQFLDYRNEDSINLTGFMDYMFSLIQERYEQVESTFKPELFKINSNVFATNILDYAKM